MDERHDLARRARAATGLNQRTFARMLGVNTATVCAWERGGRNPARRMRVLLRLVSALPDRCMEVLLAEADGSPGPAHLAGGPKRVGDEGVPEVDAEGALVGDLPGRVLEAARRLARGPRGLVALDELRRASVLRGVERGELDRLLLELEARGEVVLREPLFPWHLSEAERAAAVRDRYRHDLVFLETQPVPEEDLDS